jgi:hypothetical protein
MPKNITLNIGNFKNLFGNLIKNLRWVFFAGFLIILALEVFQIKNSFSVALNINQEVPVGGSVREVRINFDNYNQAINRIQQAANYVPTGGVTKNPFAVQVVLQPAQ